MKRIELLMMGVLLMAASSAWGAAVWNGTGTGDWAVAGNWTGGPPSSTVDAQVNNGGTPQISSGSQTCLNLFLPYSGATGGNLQILGGSLTLSGIEYFGYAAGSGTGTLLQSGGTYDLGNHNSYIGYKGPANFTLNGTGVRKSVLSEYVGFNAEGHFIQDDSSSHTGTSLYVAGGTGNSSGTGTYELKNGTLTTTTGTYCGGNGALGQFLQTGGTHTVAAFQIGAGSAGTGKYIISGGTLTASGATTIGVLTGSTGDLQVSGSANVTFSGYEYIGGYSSTNTGTGTVEITGGSVTVKGNHYISVGGNGTLTMSGGALSLIGTSYSESVGYVSTGTGTVTQSGGTYDLGGRNSYIGQSGPGNYTLNGTGTRKNIGTEHVGYNAAGHFIQDDTSSHSGSVVFVGAYSNTSGAGTYELKNGTLTTTTYTGVGGNNAALSSFIQTGGTHLPARVILGYGSNAGTGQYIMSGGTLTIGNRFDLGYVSNGVFTVVGGSPAISMGAYIQTSRGTLQDNISGGQISAINTTTATLAGTWTVTDLGGTTALNIFFIPSSCLWPV